MAPTKPSTIRTTYPNLPKTKPFRKEKKGPPAKQIFKGKEMSLSGKFISCSKIAPHSQIAGWITRHGGTFVTEVTDSTTHLICSIEDFKKKTTQGTSSLPNIIWCTNEFSVAKAWSLGSQRCKIVVFDWIEDCLIRTKVRSLAERTYTLDYTLKHLGKKKKDLEDYREKFARGVQDCADFVGQNVNHIYFDDTGFEYKIVLTRINFIRGKTRTEKFTLYLFRSIASPYTYMFAAKLRSTDRRETSYYREHCTPRHFAVAFANFCNFFKDKTGYEWDYRLHGFKNKDRFVYSPPEAGRPVGRLPIGFERPEVKSGREEEDEEGQSASGDDILDSEDQDEDGVKAGETERMRAASSLTFSREPINQSHPENISGKGNNYSATIKMNTSSNSPIIRAASFNTFPRNLPQKTSDSATIHSLSFPSVSQPSSYLAFDNTFTTGSLPTSVISRRTCSEDFEKGVDESAKTLEPSAENWSQGEADLDLALACKETLMAEEEDMVVAEEDTIIGDTFNNNFTGKNFPKNHLWGSFE